MRQDVVGRAVGVAPASPAIGLTCARRRASSETCVSGEDETICRFPKSQVDHVRRRVDGPQRPVDRERGWRPSAAGGAGRRRPGTHHRPRCGAGPARTISSYPSCVRPRRGSGRRCCSGTAPGRRRAGRGHRAGRSLTSSAPSRSWPGMGDDLETGAADVVEGHHHGRQEEAGRARPGRRRAAPAAAPSARSGGCGVVRQVADRAPPTNGGRPLASTSACSLQGPRAAARTGRRPARRRAGTVDSRRPETSSARPVDRARPTRAGTPGHGRAAAGRRRRVSAGRRGALAPSVERACCAAGGGTVGVKGWLVMGATRRASRRGSAGRLARPRAATRRERPAAWTSATSPSGGSERHCGRRGTSAVVSAGATAMSR